MLLTVPQTQTRCPGVVHGGSGISEHTMCEIVWHIVGAI